MKTTTYKFTLIVTVLFLSAQLQAQDYKTGIGLRLSNLPGITVKHFTNSNGALEGILSFGGHSFQITGLYEKHQGISGAQGLSWFFGGGAHIGFYNYGYDYYYYHYHKHKGYTYVYNGVVYDQHGNPLYYYESGHTSVNFGLDFILGLEYKIPKAPVSLGLDVKPYVDFAEGGPWFYWNGAFTARFTF